MGILQEIVEFEPRKRGFHLITQELESRLNILESVKMGLAHLFPAHTSASLILDENADITVRNDLETFMNLLIPESFGRFTHTNEGRDDMPAHIKSALFGTPLSIPVRNDSFSLDLTGNLSV